MLTLFIQLIINGLGGLVNAAEVLPTSPFANAQAVTLDNELLAMLAWFVPFPQIIAVLQAWVIAIGTWYLAMKGMRWMKLIQ